MIAVYPEKRKTKPESFPAYEISPPAPRTAKAYIACDNAWVMGAIKRRDPKGLELLYAAYSRLVFRFILSIVKRKEDAEDLLLDVFQQVWDKSELFDAGKGSIQSWLLVVARNRSIDFLRSKGFRNSSLEKGCDDEGMEGIAWPEAMSQGDQIDLARQIEKVRGALTHLSQDQRRAIEVAYFHGMSHADAAAALGLPLGTVKTRIRDGMRNLQGHLRALKLRDR